MSAPDLVLAVERPGADAALRVFGEGLGVVAHDRLLLEHHGMLLRHHVAPDLQDVGEGQDAAGDALAHGAALGLQRAPLELQQPEGAPHAAAGEHQSATRRARHHERLGVAEARPRHRKHSSIDNDDHEQQGQDLAKTCAPEGRPSPQPAAPVHAAAGADKGEAHNSVSFAVQHERADGGEPRPQQRPAMRVALHRVAEHENAEQHEVCHCATVEEVPQDPVVPAGGLVAMPLGAKAVQ
mmetsp:Transcript_55944/g.173457  ORF Transcript_55944/g.173457 Transcript_55944/m.173457 type:complete len:239 (+) Transcript_55944:390-1106(+)